jgi:hypothetical protein
VFSSAVHIKGLVLQIIIKGNVIPNEPSELLHTATFIVKRLIIPPAAISFASAISLIFLSTKSVEFVLLKREAHKAFHPSLICLKIEGPDC